MQDEFPKVYGVAECYKCGARISTSSPCCPYCGAPNASCKNMNITDKMIQNGQTTGGFLKKLFGKKRT